jgi:hypothetical protein
MAHLCRTGRVRARLLSVVLRPCYRHALASEGATPQCRDGLILLSGFSPSKLSLMAAANVAKSSSKSLILFVGGPGRTRTSNQAVMSALIYSKKAVIIGTFYLFS